ncbi:MAG: AAA family ATPase [Victivallales bacterium]|jgi:PAS domain S-box-containing protein
MISIHGYSISEKIYQGRDSDIYKAVRKDGNVPVVIKVLSREYPSQEEIARFRREYETTRSLADIKSAIQVYDLIECGNSLAMILEDFGGQSLKDLISQNRLATVKEFLIIAIKIAQALQEIHSVGIVHLDINPANILYNDTTGQIKIIDFGISIIRTKEVMTFRNSGVIEGTLAYISPEQTGRMNRQVDWRTDFYSLGATFYKMLTGRTLFESADTLELVHAHIARKPVLPHEIDQHIPKVISSITMKLLSKNVEDRYQSAEGIKTDLAQCLKRLEETGIIKDFPIGFKDISERFILPSKLYGRENEITTLVAILDRVSTGRKEMVLVSGAPGIGKTSVIREFHWHIVQKRSWFISSKFDQFVRNIPYSAIIGAFKELIHQLLSESDENLTAWREEIQTALSPNCQIMVDLIPELELIIGPQPPVSVLGAKESQNRFKIVFYDFIMLFCKREHPLVIFLDDMQWADMPSLGLIETIMSIEDRALMLICAYRDHEVNDSHPFTAAVRQIPGEFISRLHLNALGSDHIAGMVFDIVKNNRDEIEPLAALIHKKTAGNPFFAGEFLKTLNSEKLLTFDVRDYKWRWDLEHIREKGFTDNVVDLVIGNIGKFAQKTQLLLKYSSMLGNIFDLEKLSILSEASREDVFKGLNEAIHEGFVIPLNENTFTFSHDRIQQGAYNMIPEDERSLEHLRAGRLLWSGIEEDRLDDNLFVILDQFNKGIRLIKSGEEKLKISELNYKAGKKAKESAAFFPAYQFFKAGIELLDESSWKSRYDFTLSIHNNAAEAAYLSTDHDGMERLGRIILKNIRITIDKAPFYVTRVKAATSQGKMVEALDIGLDFLDELGVHIPRNPSKTHISINSFKTRLALRGITPKDIARFPDTKDPRLQAILAIMENIYASAHFCAPKTLAVIVYKVIRILVKERVSYSVSRIFFMLYGAFFGGHEYIRVPELLANRPDAKESEVIGLFLNAYSVLHWKEHLRETFPLLMRTYAVGLELGNFVYVGFAVLNRFRHMFIAGVEFSEMEKDFETYVPVLFRLKQDRSAIGCLLFHQAVLNLMGSSDDPCIISGNVYREEEKISYHELGKDLTILFTFYFLKMFLCYLFGRNAEAMKNSITAEICMGTLGIQANSGSYYFYDSLVHLTGIDQLSDKERRESLKRVDGNQKKLKKWAHNTPVNYKHKHLLVKAELSRIKGRINATMDYYDQAIANELAGRFYLDQEKEKIASVYLTDARYLYQRWGALAKVGDMDRKYPWLSSKVRISSKDNSEGTTNTSTTESGLDTGSILKASRALSEEIILERLLSQLMRIVMENAGAQRGFLALNNNGRLTVEAQGSLESQDEPVLKSAAIDREIKLSAAVVHYVERTKETIVLNDAANEGPFIQDEYIRQNKLRSVLCLPIMNQSVLTGILYLENNIAVGAFTPGRVKVLEMLASQAAISIENAKLYSQLGESERNYRGLYENALEGIFQFSIEGRMISCNPSLAGMMGFSSPEDLLKRSINVFEVGFADPQVLDEMMRILLDQGQVVGFDMPMIRKDRRKIWVAVSARTVRNANGEVAYLEGSLLDVTEKREKENEQRKREAAEAASQAKGEFLARMSHEIRTPMNAIIGFSELLSKLDMTAKQQDYLYKVISSAKSLLGIINDILDFSKIEAGKLRIETVEFRLDEIINTILNLFSLSASEKGIKLITDIPPDVPCFVKGDPLRLGQVLSNLVSNAVKFTEQGYVLLKVELLQKKADSCRIRFIVRDTGIGMTREQAETIFEAFAQAENSVTRRYGGTGLGLTISRQLLRLMGSELDVESEPGKGTAFAFTLEAGCRTEMEARRESKGLVSSGEILPELISKLKGTRILLVEDNLLNQEIASEILKEAGIIVETALTGREALEKLSGRDYDLVLMDIEMPVMGGYEATRRIRSGGNDVASLPIIAMTAHAMEGVREECIEAGMNDYICKPIDPEGLYTMIYQWIDPRRAEEKIKILPPGITGEKHEEYFPESLPGIDMADGLKRLMGKKPLYRKALLKFFRQYSAAPEEIRSGLEQGNFHTIRILAHNIKGTAAMLSVTKAFEAARELEALAKKGEASADYLPLISALEDALQSGAEAVKILEQG